MSRLFILAIVAVALAGCGEGVVWVNPSMTDSQAKIKHYECTQNGRQLLAHRSSNLFMAIDSIEQCLTAHGFSRQKA